MGDDLQTVFIIRRCRRNGCQRIVKEKGDMCCCCTAKVELLRELAAELKGSSDARWSGWVYSADVADDIAKMLTGKADALEASGRTEGP